MAHDRMDQVNATIRQELDACLKRFYDPPRDCLVTIEEVATSRDLGQCKIFVSVFPDAQTDNVLRHLDAVKNECRAALHRRLSLKTIPTLLFVADHREERAAHVTRLLDESEREE